MPTTAALTRLRVAIQLLPSFIFLPEANLLRAPTPRAIVSRLEEEMENRQKDIDPLVTPVSSTEQHQTGLTSASFWNRPPAFRLQPVH